MLSLQRVLEENGSAKTARVLFSLVSENCEKVKAIIDEEDTWGKKDIEDLVLRIGDKGKVKRFYSNFVTTFFIAMRQRMFINKIYHGLNKELNIVLKIYITVGKNL